MILNSLLSPCRFKFREGESESCYVLLERDKKKKKMILRTPPEKRTRGGVADSNAIPIIESPQSDHHHIVINEDNNISPLQPSSPEQLLCTYQCRQLVLLNIKFLSQLLLASSKECVFIKPN